MQFHDTHRSTQHQQLYISSLHLHCISLLGRSDKLKAEDTHTDNTSHSHCIPYLFIISAWPSAALTNHGYQPKRCKAWPSAALTNHGYQPKRCNAWPSAALTNHGYQPRKMQCTATGHHEASATPQGSALQLQASTRTVGFA